MACLGQSNCIGLQIVGGALRADATISPDSQNLFSTAPDGLFAFQQRGPIARMFAANGGGGITGSCASAGNAVVGFTGVSYDISNDPYNLLAPSCDVPNNRFVCRRAGHYHAGCSVTWQNMPAAGKMAVEAFVVGGVGTVSIARKEATINNVIGDLPLTTSTIIFMGVGDSLFFQINNNSGATRNIYNPYPPFGHLAWLTFIRS